jgi:hypothetical protein
MQRLRQLSEAECYARCYGSLGSSEAVRVLRVEPSQPRDRVTGELLRSLLEARLDAREPEAA